MGQNTSREETKLSLQEHKAKANTKLKAGRQKPQPEPMPSLPSLSPHPSSSTIPYDQELQRPASIHSPTFSSNMNDEDINMVEEAKKETLQKSLLEEDETNEDHTQKMPYMYEYIIHEAEVIPFSYTIAELKRGIYINNHTKGFEREANSETEGGERPEERSVSLKPRRLSKELLDKLETKSAEVGQSAGTFFENPAEQILDQPAEKVVGKPTKELLEGLAKRKPQETIMASISAPATTPDVDITTTASRESGDKEDSSDWPIGG
ncbi:hypothetical protein KSP40_PGU009552 [Platanthera guangdongensis]|uniref:Uncharacterized protein n=1 Tax=Platanthera guangdongensis TaxID=2320717 RepID=A0ABR2N1X3_9ASPA